MNKAVYLILIFAFFLTSCTRQINTIVNNKKIELLSKILRKNKIKVLADSIKYSSTFITRIQNGFIYNGKSFTNFYEKEGLKIPAVMSILEDKKGRI
jgi:hypothetical protein